MKCCGRSKNSLPFFFFFPPRRERRKGPVSKLGSSFLFFRGAHCELSELFFPSLPWPKTAPIAPFLLIGRINYFPSGASSYLPFLLMTPSAGLVMTERFQVTFSFFLPPLRRVKQALFGRNLSFFFAGRMRPSSLSRPILFPSRYSRDHPAT